MLFQWRCKVATTLALIPVLAGAGCSDEQRGPEASAKPYEWLRAGLLSKNKHARQHAFQLCKANWSETRHYFATLIGSETMAERATSAYLFSRLGTRDDLPLLRRCLADPSRSVRLNAIRGIARLDDQDSVPLLLSLLNTGLNYEERGPVLQLVARLDPQVASTYCATLATHKGWSQRRTAARALGLLDDNASSDLLLKLIDDPVWLVRIDAAESLGGRKVLASRSRVLLLAAEEMPRLRAAGVRCLARLGFREDIELVGRLALSDDAKIVRIAATAGLGEFPEQVAFPLVARVLSKKGEHKKVRFAAIQALRCFASEAALTLSRETVASDLALQSLAIKKDAAAPPNKD